MSSTGASPSSAGLPEAHVFRLLYWPQMRRWLVIQPAWALGLSLFYTALETAGGAYVTQFGFSLYLVANLIGVLCSTVGMLIWYAVASPLWRRSEATRIRYEQEGMYAVLPWPLMLPIGALAIFAAGWIHHDLWVAFLDWSGSMTTQRRDVTTRETSMVFYAFGACVIMSVDCFWVRAHKQRQRAETAHRLQVEAQLQRLQAQMEPHMLFNTLANLHALIETQPARAQDMLSHLIDYLRATLSASRRDALPLREEMARVSDYLALMQIRMGERLRVDIDVPADVGDIELPPMLIQPLVENAIKHGLDPVRDGGTLRIDIQRQSPDMLEVNVRDDGQGLEASGAQPTASGFGLSCIKARLLACYGAQASFAIGPDAGGRGTLAVLRLPVKLPPGVASSSSAAGSVSAPMSASLSG